MEFNNPSSDYLTYKKSKMNPGRVQRVEKRIEKVKRILKLSCVSFCIMFLFVVVFIKKYAKRVDIEYGRHGIDAVKNNDVANLNDSYFDEAYDADKRTIDKRLILIQQEENAPSESRVLPDERDKNEVMNLEHFEMLKNNMDEAFEEENKVDRRVQTEPVKKEETKPAVAAQKPVDAGLMPKIQTSGDVSSPHPSTQGDYAPIELPKPANIKVLIGKYPTFDEAKTAQSVMKNSKARVAPFIRKVDGTYSLQIGSYSNMDVARSVAGNYAREGFDVWIYQN